MTQNVPAGIDTTVPSSARIWNYWLGGKDHYEVDRSVGDEIERLFPGIKQQALQGRHFLSRVVRYLAGTVGVDQFLDIGTGLPTADNTHEVAQRVKPDARVVYVDNDPLVLSHARALLTGTSGRVSYIDADLGNPNDILAQARSHLDFKRPVALMLLCVLPHVEDLVRARAIVGTLVDALAPGSFLVVAHDTADLDNGPIAEAAEYFREQGGPPVILRSRQEVAGFFTGLHLIAPGVVPACEWRPEINDPSVVEDLYVAPLYAAVGQKPLL